MTRYDPNTHPFMQHWSKWPFHTEGVEGNQSNTSSLFGSSSPLPLPLLYILQQLHVEATYSLYTHMPIKAFPCKITSDPNDKQSLHGCIHLMLLFAAMYSSLCLFVFCLAPLAPSLSVSCQTHSHVITQKPRQVTKMAKTSLPITLSREPRADPGGAIIMANSLSLAWGAPRRGKKKWNEKS